MKRVVSIQDISCIGKCSQTVALPIISAFGVETAVVPTAVLSTHTAFSDFTFRDLTADMGSIVHHWKQEKFTFDTIYTGYLGSQEQIQSVSDLIDTFRTDKTLVIIDPVMGDNGKLYAGFTEDFPQKIAALCSKADVLVPNLTEAAALLGIPYEENYEEAYIKDILRRLTDLGVEKVVLTGVLFSGNRMGVMTYDRETDTYFSYAAGKVPRVFHGTGDIFASVLTGALTRGMDLEKALRLAVDFTVLSIEKTLEDPTASWYGVNFEEVLPWLIRQL